MNGKILVVDDKQIMRDSVGATLQRAGMQIISANNGLNALTMIAKHRPDAVVTDLKMPEMDGMGLLMKLKEIDDQLPLVLMTAYGTVDVAVSAMKQGAFDFVQKPFEGDQLVLTMKRAIEHRRLTQENAALKSGAASSDMMPMLIGQSQVMRKLVTQIKQISASNGTVLVHGESGVGKEVIARTIHACSQRRERVMLCVNCAALSSNLLESELFGHEKGSFTGAEQMRTDLAIRWSHYLGPFELGLHHFSGTSREPMLLPEYAVDNEVVLRPYYPIIDQTGIDAQAFYGDWAFKLEGFTRSGYGDRYASLSGGLERTLVGVLGSRADFGLVLEYYWDERGDAAVNTLFENDLALGGRLSLNDFADTQALLGVIYDTQYQDYVMTLEASRRIGNNWLLSLEGRAFAGGKALPTPLGLNVLEGPDYKSAWLQQDDYLQVEFKKFL